MAYHKLLEKQIKKLLNKEFTEHPLFEGFIKTVNESYIAFDRDKELMDHAFMESEKEYNEINENLKKEYDLKKQSIDNLYNSLETLEDDHNLLENATNKEDLLFISNYLKLQIEKRQEIKENLSTTVELLKTLLANMQSGILVEDENGKILFTNHLFCDIFSIPISPEEMVGVEGKNSLAQIQRQFKDETYFEKRINLISKERKIVIGELIETADHHYLERDYIPIFINNEHKGHLWKYTDVTNRIQNQKLLRQSEERNRLIMDSALNAIVAIDSNSIITFWNDQAENIFGWTREEAIGRTLIETIMPNKFGKNNLDEIKNYKITGKGKILNRMFEQPALHKNGNEILVEMSIIPIEQNGDIFYCSFIQDISERKKAETNLRHQEEKYRNIIANMNLGLLEVDNNQKVQFVNHSFTKLSGYESDELMGKNPSDLFVLPENKEIINKKIRLRNQGVSDIYQIKIRNKKGEIRWWVISGAPNFDDKGNLIGSIGIHLDITEQKLLEIELEKEKIKAEDASKAKEMFLANMSHEIRTPLNAIIGFLRELDKQDLTDLQKTYIQNSSIASKHLLAIINNVLDISKIEAGEMSLKHNTFDIIKSINNTVKVLKPKADQKSIQLYTNISENVSSALKGDALRIEQILFNLIGNSLKFTNKGKIELKCVVLKDTPDSQILQLSISDTGIGIEKEFMKKMFKKFSQENLEITKKFGGTGLGMAITNELVQLMKGKINVESQKNEGTTITLTLHFEKGDPQDILKTIPEKTSININNISILLVEDNDLNRMVAQNTLQYYNTKVTEAEDGLEALKILEKQSFDIILMDIQMPQLDGIETTKIIRKELKLDTPIIALTANAFKSEVEKCKEAGMNDYVSKPFDENNLLEIISKYTSEEFKNKGNTNKMKNLKVFNNKLYNLKSLVQLSRGDQEFLQRMLHIFVEQTEQTLPQIKIALDNKDFDSASRLMHKIKPSIEGVGITSLSEDVKRFEIMAKTNPDIKLLDELLHKIQEILTKAIEQIKAKEF